MPENAKRKFHKKWEDLHIGLKVLTIIGGAVAGVGFFILIGFVVMWLWNALLPKIFGLPAIGYWEAWGILVLARILFGGLRKGTSSSDHSRKKKLRERIKEMETTEDETQAPDAINPAI